MWYPPLLDRVVLLGFVEEEYFDCWTLLPGTQKSQRKSSKVNNRSALYVSVVVSSFVSRRHIKGRAPANGPFVNTLLPQLCPAVFIFSAYRNFPAISLCKTAQLWTSQTMRVKTWFTNSNTCPNFLSTYRNGAQRSIVEMVAFNSQSIKS